MSIESGIKYFEATQKNVPEFSEKTIHPLLMDGVEVARRLLPFNETEAQYLDSLLLWDRNETSLWKINQTISGVAKRADDKLQTVAMGVLDYFAAYNAFHSKNAEVFAGHLVEKTEAKLNLDSVPTTLETRDPKEVEKKHIAIIDEILGEIPVSKKGNQRLIIVAGPFAGGKSETVHSKLDTRDVLEIDLDVLRGRLMTGYDQSNQKDIQKVREESWVLSDILLKKALQTGRSVIIQTALHRQDRWLNDANLIYANQNHINMDIYMVLRPVADCLARNVKRNGRTVSFKDLTESVYGMSVLPKVIEKFKNTNKVVLLDYFPLIESTTGLKCEYGRGQYEKLIKYAEKQQAMHVQRQHVDIHVEAQ